MTIEEIIYNIKEIKRVYDKFKEMFFETKKENEIRFSEIEKRVENLEKIQ